VAGKQFRIRTLHNQECLCYICSMVIAEGEKLRRLLRARERGGKIVLKPRNTISCPSVQLGLTRSSGMTEDCQTYITVKPVPRDSSVGIVTRYGLDGPGDRILVWAIFSAPVQTGPGAHPTSYTRNTRSLSPG
jgi:hypothetical protein